MKQVAQVYKDILETTIVATNDISELHFKQLELSDQMCQIRRELRAVKAQHDDVMSKIADYMAENKWLDVGNGVGKYQRILVKRKSVVATSFVKYNFIPWSK